MYTYICREPEASCIFVVNKTKADCNLFLFAMNEKKKNCLCFRSKMGMLHDSDLSFKH
jgi:hypothetical protein